MTEIYVHFMCAHYGLYGNAPVVFLGTVVVVSSSSGSSVAVRSVAIIAGPDITAQELQDLAADGVPPAAARDQSHHTAPQLVPPRRRERIAEQGRRELTMHD